ncbi:unnamed protein product, partial [Laminaria digitata]
IEFGLIIEKDEKTARSNFSTIIAITHNTRPTEQLRSYSYQLPPLRYLQQSLSALVHQKGGPGNTITCSVSQGHGPNGTHALARQNFCFFGFFSRTQKKRCEIYVRTCFDFFSNMAQPPAYTHVTAHVSTNSQQLTAKRHERVSLICVHTQKPSGLALAPCALRAVDERGRNQC